MRWAVQGRRVSKMPALRFAPLGGRSDNMDRSQRARDGEGMAVAKKLVWHLRHLD
jgi:hypothetical protein